MNPRPVFRGSIPALVTPMHEDGSVDVTTFQALLDWHVSEGSDAVVVAGTTGEASTLGIEEQFDLVKTACRHLNGRLPVIAGTGANSTAEAVELARLAQKAGAQAHLSVVPYYNKPGQNGIIAHFQAVAEACELPMILYNVPGRTVADIANDTVLALAETPNIIGIKDATGDMGRGFDLLCRRPSGFQVFSGDDETALALTMLGGDGVISVTANAFPRIMHLMMADACRGSMQSARDWNAKLQEMHRALFVEPNPAPLKWILARHGKLKNMLRLPLVPLSEIYEPRLVQLLEEIG
ncbi:4-hydroxy-tetrahydrodipicolinate synthase [Allopusillimonas ginsengisoli]|uniref:4-hydroxy-tetrahydrodipicolinate synthase n=1 Tax=Allopusillimonas ginsengisoli TaxID=453575 RepID=UPI00102088F8|nr:4-hydroxy-tetrahydrodipicolinate synthase [Allopusillimonas ginsengisoli]TEA80009.1 4-hydroxy-tetrahydrodipicolinate synthase [Allopusillimonas ginsengisoli]